MEDSDPCSDRVPWDPSASVGMTKHLIITRRFRAYVSHRRILRFVLGLGFLQYEGWISGVQCALNRKVSSRILPWQ